MVGAGRGRARQGEAGPCMQRAGGATRGGVEGRRKIGHVPWGWCRQASRLGAAEGSNQPAKEKEMGQTCCRVVVSVGQAGRVQDGGGRVEVLTCGRARRGGRGRGEGVGVEEGVW